MNKRELAKEARAKLRRYGWKIERKTLARIGSWKAIRLVNPESRNPKIWRQERDKLKPFGRGYGYRIYPPFLKDFRDWFYGARKLGAVRMLTCTFKSPRRIAMQNLFETLGLYDLGRRGMKYRGRPWGSKNSSTLKKARPTPTPTPEPDRDEE